MEEIMIGREMNPKEMIPEEENQEGAKIFGKLAGASLLYALVYTGCLFENVMGLASVLWVAVSVWYVRFVFRMFGEKERRDNGIVLGMMVLLGISTVLTGNEWIGWMNDLIIFVLLVGILLHNFAQDAGWNFGKYLAEIVAAVCGAVCFIGKPFADGGAFYRSKKTRESHAGWYVLIGICAAVPCLMVLVLLLMSADMVFADLLVRFAGVFRFPVKLFRILFMLVFGFLSSYCGVRYVQKHAADIKPSAGKTAEPLIAIAFTAPIAVLYLLFSAIQIVYLFIGNMQLPAGVTYAEYARRGFFQLLFVCVLNLAAVLSIQGYFKENRVLKALLLAISGCTLIMTASSACRMILYIRAYQLTFLRVSVLVALAVIALLMAGVIAKIVKPQFPLFRYGFVLVGAVYLVFSFSHVDYFIAAYNLTHTSWEASGEETVDYSYLYTLSTDAAPAIEKYAGKSGAADYRKQGWYQLYCEANEEALNETGLRTYNVSHAVAKQLLMEDNRE